MPSHLPAEMHVCSISINGVDVRASLLDDHRPVFRWPDVYSAFRLARFARDDLRDIEITTFTDLSGLAQLGVAPEVLIFATALWIQARNNGELNETDRAFADGLDAFQRQAAERGAKETEKVFFSLPGAVILSCILSGEDYAPERSKSIFRRILITYRKHGGRGYFGEGDCWLQRENERGHRLRRKLADFYDNNPKASKEVWELFNLLGAPIPDGVNAKGELVEDIGFEPLEAFGLGGKSLGLAINIREVEAVHRLPTGRGIELAKETSAVPWVEVPAGLSITAGGYTRILQRLRAECEFADDILDAVDIIRLTGQELGDYLEGSGGRLVQKHGPKRVISALGFLFWEAINARA